MQIVLKFRDPDARTVTYYLRKRYGSKADLKSLAMLAIRKEVANEAQKELEEGNIDKLV
jgi:hypothetical protein